MFFNLFSRKKKKNASFDDAQTGATPVPREPDPVVLDTAVDLNREPVVLHSLVPDPAQGKNVTVKNDDAIQQSATTDDVAAEPSESSDTAEPAETEKSAEPAKKERAARPARASSPRTSAAKVAPPKATPPTRPGNKPAAKPVSGQAAGQAGPTTPSSTRPNKPTKQGLLDAVASADAADMPPAIALPSASVPTPASPAEGVSDSATDLATRTVPQLRLRAKELGLVGYSRLAKAELVRVITEKLSTDSRPTSPPPTEAP